MQKIDVDVQETFSSNSTLPTFSRTLVQKEERFLISALFPQMGRITALWKRSVHCSGCASNGSMGKLAATSDTDVFFETKVLAFGSVEKWRNVGIEKTVYKTIITVFSDIAGSKVVECLHLAKSCQFQ